MIIQNLLQKIKIILFFAVIILAGFGFVDNALAAYYTTGNWTSVNLLSGETVSSIDSFVYNLSAKPANTGATVGFNQDGGSTWYNAAGNVGTETLVTGGEQTITLTSGWSGPNFYYKITFTSDGTDTPVLDDISVYFTSNQPPDTPTNTLPTNGATNQSLTPTLTSSAYSDNESDPHSASQWQVTTISGNYSSPVFDSGEDAANKTSITVPGSTLSSGTTYYWHVRHKDAAWSNYSTETSFTTTDAPSTPTNTSPTNGSNVNDLTPDLESSAYSDPNSDSHSASQWQVATISGNYSSPVFDSGEDAVSLTSITVSPALSWDDTYYWHVRHKDNKGAWSSYSTETSFNTLNTPPNTPTNTLPTNGATNQSLTPTLTSSAFSDTEGHGHSASQWQVDDNSNFSSPEWDSGEAGATTSADVPGSQLSPGVTYYWHVRYKDDSGASNPWSSYSSYTNFTTGYAPNTPTNTSPANGADVNDVTPTLQSSAFSDPDAESTHAYSQWQVTTISGNYSSPVFDSGQDAVNKTSITVSPALSWDDTYYWHVRHKDDSGNWSSYSTETSFNTLNTPPNTPTNTLPTNGATNQSVTPSLTASAYSDSEGHTHFASQWQITTISGNYGSPVFDSGEDAVNLTGITVSPALSVGTQHYWHVRHKDNTGSATAWSSYSTETSFTTGYIPNTPTNTSPANGSNVNDITPDLQSSAFSDPDAESTHAYSQWQVTTISGNYSSPVFDSGEDGSNLTSITVSPALSWDDTYYWHVRHKDDSGNWSSYSTETSFNTLNTPPNTPTNTLPSNGATNQSVTPSLTASAYSDPEGHTHSASQWQITTISGNYSSPVFDSGEDGSNLTSITVSPALSVGTQHYWHVRHKDNTGSATAWSSYSTETSFTTGYIPNTPTNTSPANGSNVNDITPDLQSSAFSDPDAESTHAYSQWQVTTISGNYSSPVFDSGQDAVNKTSITVSPALSWDDTYYWHVRHKDDSGNWSSYSTETSFNTLNTPPNTPTNTLPTNGATNQSLTPTLTSSAFSDTEGHSHSASQWQVTDTSGDYSSPVWDSGEDGANLTSIAVSPALSVGATYYWHVKYKDDSGASNPWSSYSAETNFTTGYAPNTPTNTSPANGADVDTVTPTLSASAYSDPDSDPHVASQWQITTTSGNYSSPVWDSGEDGANLTSVTVPGSNLSWDDTYYWHVKYKDNTGNWSSYSTETSFNTLNIAPDTPSNFLPADQTARYIVTPTLIASTFSDSNGNSHTASQWQITTTSGNYSSPVFDSGEDSVNKINITIPSGNLSFGNKYYWHVRYKDDTGSLTAWSNYSGETSFIVTETEILIKLGGQNIYKPGDTIMLDAQIRDAETLAPINDATITINIFDPDKSTVASGVTMSYVSGSNGLYSYSTTTSSSFTSGTYIFDVKVVSGARVGYNFSSFWIDPWREDITKIKESIIATTGQADSGTTLTLVDSTLTQIDDFWNGMTLVVTEGTNVGEIRQVADFDAASDTITVDSSFSLAIDSTSKYLIRRDMNWAERVWNHTSRTLTEFAAVAADVWSYSNRTLTDFGTLVADIWAYSSRTLTEFAAVAADVWSYSNRTLTDFGSLATDVWNAATRKLTSRYTDEAAPVDLAQVADVSSLATSAELAAVKTDIIAEIDANEALLNNLNNISAQEVWEYGTRGLTETVSLSDPTQAWDVAVSALTETGSIGKQVADNLDAQVSTRSTLTAGDVWSESTRTLTDYATSSIALAVWNNAQRTLTSYGNDITATDVWNVLSSTLTTENSIGKQLADNVDATISSRAPSTTALSSVTWTDEKAGYLDAVISSRASQVSVDALQTDITYIRSKVDSIYTDTQYIRGEVDTIINKWGVYSAADIITDLDTVKSRIGISTDTAATETLFGRTKFIQEKWGVQTAQTIYDKSDDAYDKIVEVQTELGYNGTSTTAFADIQLVKGYTNEIEGYVGTPSDNSSADTLFGKIKDVREKLDQLDTLESKIDIVDSVVDSIRASQQLNYTVELSDAGEVETTKTYRAKLSIWDYENNPVNASTTPTIIIYDALRAAANTGSMTELSTGVYEYTYAVASDATTGLWESVVSVDLGGSSTLTLNDYWEVEGSPAQVIINSMSDTTVPSISANVTISNEGNSGYEYQYEWCVVTSQDNQCGGDDDIDYASAAKYLGVGEDYTANLSLTVPNTGDYWFKVVVYYGTEASGASRTFTATGEGEEEEEEEEEIVPPGGGGAAAPTVNLSKIYNKLLEIQNELGYHGTKRTAYKDMSNTRYSLGALPNQLSEPLYTVLAGVSSDIKTIGGDQGYNLDDLYTVSQTGSGDLKYIINKTAELKAVIDVNKSLISTVAHQPIIKMWWEQGSIILKIMVVNPPDADIRAITVKEYLPKEIRAEDIIEIEQGLEIEYDSNLDNYYVTGEVELGPGERKVFKIEIEYVFSISEEKLIALKEQAETLMRPLEGTGYFAQGAILRSEINANLKAISEEQATAPTNIEKRISLFRKNQKELERVQENIEDLKKLVNETSGKAGIFGSLFGVSTTMTWAIIIIVVVGVAVLMILLYTILMRSRALEYHISGGKRLKAPPMVDMKKQAIKIKGGFITYFLPPFGKPIVDLRQMIKMIKILIIIGILVVLVLLGIYYFQQ